MGLSFFFTVLVMVVISIAGPKINAKAFAIDSSMFKLKPQTTALIAVILLLLAALYIKFW
jgi:SSS family solute:Na+ symporter